MDVAITLVQDESILQDIAKYLENKGFTIDRISKKKVVATANGKT